MDLGIQGKKAIICASSKGLGRACAISLAQNGVAVVINGREKSQLKLTAEYIKSTFDASVIAIQADISTPEGQAALLAACPDPDILINNNGGPPFRDFMDLDREAMLSGVTMNMVTPIELIQKIVPGMTKRHFGRIVNITSLSVKMPIPGLDLSSGSRAGLTSFLAGVAPKVINDNVTINNILPGLFLTDRHKESLTKTMQENNLSYEDAVKKLASDIPAKRFGDPSEFGEVCAFLCGKNASYITGQNLLIDGGRFPGAF